MPLRVTDQIHWCPSTPGRRWARQDSADLIGHGRQRPLLRVIRPPGRELRLAAAPARLTRGGRPQGPITNQRKELGDSAPTARPQKTGAQVGSRLQLEWLADGCTAVCFWTGRRRLIASLES